MGDIMKKTITIIAVTYAAIVMLFYVVTSIVASACNMDISSKIGITDTMGIVTLIFYILSQSFLLVSLFFIKKRYGLIVSIAFLFSAYSAKFLGGYVSTILVVIALVTATIMFFIGLVHKGLSFSSKIWIVVLSFLVVPLNFLGYMLSPNEIYQGDKEHVNLDGSHAILVETRYDIKNNPTNEYYELREHKYIDLGFSYFYGCQLSEFSHESKYLGKGAASAEIEWIDNDTFVIDGTQYELTHYIE